ncbi:ankyrin repeat domain-containing protein [Paenibacillus sp. JNUCC31]|uniref:ankyrin repeat domain-containing protein n=1 Tax=Paenibacillus sp. JNUCC-31 TaxID=2777983 RepID=UPI001780223B|nr:ankyrin repeat domain-containing protein [Paenibacillus sp. JNUCC-31]QOS80507.1 ankyrin repeat domain-containing protein [Paenibacillus sp. JNUCC-31]
MNKSLMIIILISSMFVVQGCVPEVSNDPKVEERLSTSPDELLLKAAEERDTESIEKWIQEGADINTQDKSGRTAAMIATYNNDLASAQKLIEAGADVNVQDDMKNNPFLFAGAEGYLDILKLTIDAGADPAITNRYGGTALIPASEHGYVDVVRELLTLTSVNVDHVNQLGWTALLEAIILNDGSAPQQETIQLLIDHGADVNLSDRDGVSPRIHAKNKGFKEIEEILIRAGAK